MATLKHARESSATAVLSGKLYIIGGIYDRTVLRTVERFDPETNRWTEVAEMNFPREDYHCCTVRNSIYAVGGYGGERTLHSIEKYDEQLNQWTVVRQIVFEKVLSI